MAIAVRDIDESRARWEEHLTRVIHAQLEQPTSQAELNWALAMYTGCVRTLQPRSRRGCTVAISEIEMRAAAFSPRERIVVEVYGPGDVRLRPVRESDLDERTRPAIEYGGPLPRAPRAPSERREFERDCEQCHAPFRTFALQQRFCSDCRRERTRSQQRAYSRRKGKLRPSYQRRLKRPRLPQNLVAACEPGVDDLRFAPGGLFAMLRDQPVVSTGGSA